MAVNYLAVDKGEREQLRSKKGVRDREKESRGFSGLGVAAGLPPPGASATITAMTTMTAMRPGVGSTQCRQPPAYKVAAQMARLHRLGRAHSHEGVTYRTDHEDGTKQSLRTYNLSLIHHVYILYLVYSLEFMWSFEASAPYHYR